MRFILLTLCVLALVGCTHTYQSRSDLDERLADHNARSGLRKSHNESYAKRHRPSQYERCLERLNGAERAEEICEEYVLASKPNVDERCDDCVDNPWYTTPFNNPYNNYYWR
ncbi:hypothetical protein GF380_00115 [Candidatus Uhrbacteria bacterium]|nr:hypothetical protein [Candidatus Uhrbacteria bacterium]MBD3283829.1 hypothetical protein [Candidatus Uhrbacteria bacterium]